MKIAVTYDKESGEIFQHFGHTEYFKLYEVNADMKVASAEVVSADGFGHESLALFLFRNDVAALVCGGIGGGAQMALMQAGIPLFAGVSGPADEAVDLLLQGKLVYSSEANCSHHEEAHSCGGHCEGKN